MKNLSQGRVVGRLLSAIVFAVAPWAVVVSDGAETPAATTQPGFYAWAQTPPMGWNSYDCFGDTVTEAEVLANAQYMREKLLPSGYRYIVVDFRWYDPDANGVDYRLNSDRAGAALEADAFGRLIPAPKRFPSAKGGRGFGPLAEKLHGMGLEFGIHIMRGIPRQAVKTKTPIEGSAFTAADAGDTNSWCGWCPDMYGVRNNEAGQAWYDSIFRQYAAWGLDFVKVDDLSRPYSRHEIEMIRRAIDRCGRVIVLSTSPGATDPREAGHISANANMWRISEDFWDRWNKLNEQFDLLARWEGVGGPGRWPDADMIPFGRIAQRSAMGGREHQTHFTKDEQVTLMTLWCMAPSPLMLGMNLPDLDEWTLKLITNRDVLAIDQDPLGRPARRVAVIDDRCEVWTRELADGAEAVAVFNRGEKAKDVIVKAEEIGVGAEYQVCEVWGKRELGAFGGKPLKLQVPAHGAVLLRLTR